MGAGVFITFEGSEGGGKSEQIERLAERLGSAGYGVVQTREPGGTPRAEAIRNVLLYNLEGLEPVLPMVELLLFAASRAQHVGHLILPNLQEGRVVLSDRFYDSTGAYQKGGGVWNGRT